MFSGGSLLRGILSHEFHLEIKGKHGGVVALLQNFNDIIITQCTFALLGKQIVAEKNTVSNELM